jgi:hypothetical protein
MNANIKKVYNRAGKHSRQVQGLLRAGWQPLRDHAPRQRLQGGLQPQKSPQGKRWQELGEKYLLISTGQRDLSTRPARCTTSTDGQEVYVETDRGRARMHAPR